MNAVKDGKKGRTMKKDFDDIKSQAQFCTELMLRLNADIHDADYKYDCVVGHSRMEADIIRLRRELNDLRKMLYPY
jgi:hypothetical protein